MSPRAKDPVGAQIVATLESTFRKYLVLDEGLPLVLALWALTTHVFECFDAFPYLAITSPTKRCGKTRLAEVLELLVVKGLRAVGASPAAIFRSIDKDTPTLIVDEAEALSTKSERSEALREILNAGYRTGQFVLRCDTSGDGKYPPKRFKTYCPKVLVLIGNLPDTLADRCIPIRMRRAKQGEQPGRFRFSQASRGARSFRREVEKWSKTARTRVKRYYRTHDLKFLKDREAELWLPLYSVCAVVAPERLEAVKAVAIRLSAAKEGGEGEEIGITLLRDVRDAFQRAASDRMPTGVLIEELTAIEEGPWQAWAHGRPLNARGLARLLRPFRIEPRNLRIGDRIVKGYGRDDFEEAWASYVPGVSATPLQGA